MGNKIISITLVLLLGIFVQVLLGFWDMQDTPNKAVAEFSKAYFKLNEAVMSDRLCEEKKVADDVDVVKQYVYEATQRAKELGYTPFYLKNKLYHIRTYTLSKDFETAKIKLTAERKPPLKSFFTKEGYEEVEEIFKLVKEDGKWKICNAPFSLEG